MNSNTMRIRITCGQIAAEAELNDSRCAKAIFDASPITGSLNRWGEEIYFSIPVHCELEDSARCDVEVGEIAYWPAGSALCIFFGRTPASTSDRPRAASEVNPLGQIVGDAKVFAAAGDGQEIVVESLP